MSRVETCVGLLVCFASAFAWAAVGAVDDGARGCGVFLMILVFFSVGGGADVVGVGVAYDVVGA